MIQTQFKRYELKYLLNEKQAETVRKGMTGRMREDAYGKSTVCNLYFDTPDFRLIRRSLEKPVYKEKLRLRSYGVPGEKTTVFLELKKKYDGVVYKRRACMALDAAERFLQAPAPGTQIERELAYALTLYPALAPRVALCYDREAFYAMDDPELRMTFDSDIRWRAEALDLRTGTDGTPILTPGQVLLEVKTATAVPLWLCRLLSGAGIRQTSFSKYGRAYQTIAGQIPTYVLHKGEQRYA